MNRMTKIQRVVKGLSCGAAALIVSIMAQGVTVVSSATSGKMMIDTRAGQGSIEIDGHTEDITYSNLWSGEADATATVTVNGEIVKTETGEGVYRWLPPSKGRIYVLTHTTTKNGTQVGETLTATLIVGAMAQGATVVSSQRAAR